jgi:sterol 3beta-glucosyltransferase
MRVGIQGWGSEGDLRPLVALAGRLRAEGHAPRLLLTPMDGKDYTALCASLDVPLQIVPERMTVTLEELVRDAKKANPTKLLTAVMDLTFFPYVEALYAASLELCAASDVVVGGSLSWPLKAASLHASVPFAVVDYFPGMVPSREAPPALFPPWAWLARPAWALMHVMMDMGFRKAPQKFFADKGLPPIKHTIPDVVFSDRLNLHAASPAFWPPARDWSDIHCVCGELLVPAPVETWTPSPALRAFLDEGSPPVLLSLGSWEHLLPDRIPDLLAQSARHAKTRAIVQTKKNAAEGRDGDVYFLPWAPHHQLVPMCSAVVHHGGAGTTHMALRAGKPALVLPFIIEQRMWAKRLTQVGAGTSLSFWKATPEKVGRLIQEVAASEPLHRRASEIASAMTQDDGTGLATQRLERLVAPASAP